jgi:hypothetical protein
MDVFLVMRDGFQPHDAPPEAQNLFRHGTAQSEFGASIFWERGQALLSKQIEYYAISPDPGYDLYGRDI